MVGWHHRLKGHEFEQTRGDDEGQESLACSLAGGFLTISTTWVLCVDHYQTENYAMDIFTEHIGLTHEHCTSHYILLFPHSYWS